MEKTLPSNFKAALPYHFIVQGKQRLLETVPRIVVYGDVVLSEDESGKIIKQATLLLGNAPGILIHKNESDAFLLTDLHTVAHERLEDIEIMIDGKAHTLTCTKAYILACFSTHYDEARIYAAEVAAANHAGTEQDGLGCGPLRISSEGLGEPLKLDTEQVTVTSPVIACGFPEETGCYPRSILEWMNNGLPPPHQKALQKAPFVPSQGLLPLSPLH